MSVSEINPVERRKAGIRKWNRYQADHLPAWIAEHDFGSPPAVNKRLQELVKAEAFGYHDSEEKIGTAFSYWTTLRHSWTPDPNLILPVSDVLQGIWACIQTLSKPGETIIYSTPVYPPFLDAPTTTDRKALNWPMIHDSNGWQYDFKSLKDLLIKDPNVSLLLLCNPQNPTGKVMKREELKKIIELANEFNFFIISDEIHSDIVYPGAVHLPTLSFPEASECTVTVTSGVKTFALGGMRCAVVVAGNQDLFERLSNIPKYLLGGINRMGCEAAIEAWRTGNTWVDELLKILNENRHYLVDRLSNDLPQINFHLPESTFLAWLDFSHYKADYEISKWLRDRTTVACGSGPKFGAGGENHLRLTFGTNQNLLKKIIDRIVAGLT